MRYYPGSYAEACQLIDNLKANGFDAGLGSQSSIWIECKESDYPILESIGINTRYLESPQKGGTKLIKPNCILCNIPLVYVGGTGRIGSSYWHCNNCNDTPEHQDSYEVYQF